MLEHLDIWIAVALVVTAGTVFFLTRIGILPVKGVPFALASIAAAFGWIIFRDWQKQRLSEEARRIEREREEHRAKVAATRAALATATVAADSADVALLQQVTAVKREAVRIHETLRDEQDQIDRMTPDEVFREFDRLFPSGPASRGGP